jgi:rubrerythrin
MAERLLPRNLPEMFAFALAMEREATKRFAELERYMREAGLDHIADEFESIGKEEREQYELLALGTSGRALPEIQEWEYAWHYLGPQSWKPRRPRSAREALMLALASERRTEIFYADVAEHVMDDSVSAFAAEMAADERRHVTRLELLLRREPEQSLPEEEETVSGVHKP